MRVRAALTALAAGACTSLVFCPPASSTVTASVSGSCQGQPVTIAGTSGDDDLDGTGGDDVVSLGAGRDIFDGEGGDDVVCGGRGRDSLFGGAGDDLLAGGSGGDFLHDDDCQNFQDSECEADDDGQDRLDGGAGDDHVSIQSADSAGVGAADRAEGGGGGDDTASYSVARAGVVIDVATGTATGPAVDSLDGFEAYVGSPEADVLLGTGGADVLSGLGGVDEVRGRGGDDVLGAEQGLVRGGRGSDEFDSALAAYPRGVAVDLGTGDDLAVLQDEGTATVRGQRGADEFRARGTGSGVDGGPYEYDVSGGNGRDLLSFRRYTDGRVRADAAEGRADLRGTDFVAFVEMEVLSGSRLAGDVLLGSGRAEQLRGLGGKDLIRGRGGRDIADGGPGTDTCSAEVRRSCERR